MSNAAQRRILRYFHIATGVLIALHVYSPLGQLGWFDIAVKALVIPLVGLSGLWMWQQGRIARWWRGGKAPDGA